MKKKYATFLLALFTMVLFSQTAIIPKTDKPFNADTELSDSQL